MPSTIYLTSNGQTRTPQQAPHAAVRAEAGKAAGAAGLQETRVRLRSLERLRWEGASQ